MTPAAQQKRVKTVSKEKAVEELMKAEGDLIKKNEALKATRDAAMKAQREYDKALATRNDAARQLTVAIHKEIGV